MLTVTRHTDYAVRIVLHLAEGGAGAKATAHEIAELRAIPPAFVRRIVSRLSARGILATTRGSGGGIALSRPPKGISLLDVVVAMEGPLSLNSCVASPGGCVLEEQCGAHGMWKGASEALTVYLKKATFDRLAGTARKKRQRR